MPPCLDVYSLSGERTVEMVHRFVETYSWSDLGQVEDHELNVVPADYDGTQRLVRREDYDAVPVATLEDAIRYGVTQRRSAFSLYFAALDPWCGVMMAFTLSDEVVFGVSVHDADSPDAQPMIDAQARVLRDRLAELTHGHRSWIGSEQTPSLDPDREQPWRYAVL